jgi:hypothetical protein
LTIENYDRRPLVSGFDSSKIEFVEDSPRYGGGLESVLYGYHGEYDMTKGYFYCWQNTENQYLNITHRFEHFFEHMIDWDTSRSIIYTFTTFHVPS